MPFDATKPSRGQTYGDAIDSIRENNNSLKLASSATDNTLVLADIPALKISTLDYAAHKLDLDAHGNANTKLRVTSLESANFLAKGQRSTLAERLDEGLLPSGALKLSGLASKWINPGDVPTFINATTFSVPTDRRLVYIAGALLRFTVSSQLVYGSVSSSSFSLGVTTVVLDPGYPVLTSGLSGLEFALIAFDNNMASAIAITQNQQLLQASVVDSLRREPVESFKNGTLLANEPILRFIATRSFSLPVNLAGSAVVSLVASTSAKSFTIRKNTTNIGTVNFAASATLPTFVLSTTTSFAINDVLSLIAPAVPDTTLADIIINITGILQ